MAKRLLATTFIALFGCTSAAAVDDHASGAEAAERRLIARDRYAPPTTQAAEPAVAADGVDHNAVLNMQISEITIVDYLAPPPVAHPINTEPEQPSTSQAPAVDVSEYLSGAPAKGQRRVNHAAVARELSEQLSAEIAEYDPDYGRTTPCCKYCQLGKPCGDSCIARSKRCRVGRGCACAQ